MTTKSRKAAILAERWDLSFPAATPKLLPQEGQNFALGGRLFPQLGQYICLVLCLFLKGH
jgi:hypothetical protein